MKVTITHLKAPWPAGAAPGHVVEFPGGVPAWAVGKCTPAPDDAEVYTPPEAPVETVLAGAAVLGETAPDSVTEAELQAAEERQAAAKATKKAAKA